MAGRFWTDASVEPKRQFRWIFEFAGLPQFLVTKVNKPSFDVGSIEHEFLDYKFNYPGKVTWNELQFTLVDPVQPDATRTFYEILRSSGYVLPDDFLAPANLNPAPRTITKKKMVDQLGGQIFLKQLGASAVDGSDSVVEEWEIWNPIITKVSNGDLDYSQEGIINIDITMKYDWARLNNVPGGGSVFPYGPNGGTTLL